jgi:hypothetical protein
MRRSVPAGVLVAVLALSSFHLAAPAPAAAVGGRSDVASTTYTLDPEAARLDVAIDFTVEATSGAVTDYIDYTYVWLEESAVALQVVADQGAATLSIEERGYGFNLYRVSFSRIGPGQDRHLRITYRVPGGAPRSQSTTRLGLAFVSFCVVSNGIDGGTARLVVPSAYDLQIDAHNGELEPSTRDGLTTYQTPELDDPWSFWACIYGDNPSAYATTTVASSTGRSIELQAWPEDPGWNDQMEEQVRDALEPLEELVGRAIPGTGPIIVREVSSGELGPYAGTFDPEEGIARVSEDVQFGTVAHELSHAWFNDSLFEARWLSEGSAEWARSTVTSEPCNDPGPYPGSGKPSIANWRFAGPRASTEELAVVGYEYAAACDLVVSVANRMKPGRMRDVLTALMDDELAYRSGDEVLQGRGGAADWRQWLDAVDELGLVPSGVTDLEYAQELVSKYGAASGSATGLLPARARARALYHDLVGSIGDWTVPEAVLRPMSEWSFTFATLAMDFEASAFAAANAVNAALPEVDAVNGPVKELVEEARTQAELSDAVVAATDQQAAAEAIASARARLAEPVDPLGQIGLLGTDLRPSLAAGIAAVAALDSPKAMAAAALIDATLADASQLGAIRLGIAVAVLLIVVFCVWFLLWRRSRRRTTAAGDIGQSPPG